MCAVCRMEAKKMARNAEMTNNVNRITENKEKKRQIDKTGTIKQWIGIKEILQYPLSAYATLV